MPETSDETNKAKGERIAKVMARRGLCSRREAEAWIADGRVTVNEVTITTPATLVTVDDYIEVDGKTVPAREPTRLWLYHKPSGLVTTAKDERDRPTVFSALPDSLPRVITVGRLDINTEGLLLLTNDGGLSRILELPKTGWLRRYRVRVFGKIDQDRLKEAEHGITVDGIDYEPLSINFERTQGHNHWLEVGLREGKNREIKRIMESFDLRVSRLIRVSYGPFQLGDLARGDVKEVRSRYLRDQLGEKLIKEAGCIFPSNANIQKSRLGLQPRSLAQGGKPKPYRLRGKAEQGGGKPDQKASNTTKRFGKSSRVENADANPKREHAGRAQKERKGLHSRPQQSSKNKSAQKQNPRSSFKAKRDS